MGTKLVTNNSANTSFEQSTLPFGTALDAETTGTTNQRFTTYDRSNVAQLDYAVNRSYSAGTGRFTSVDPIGMGATNLGNPQSMNLYAYVENNPIDFVDPSGLDALSDAIKSTELILARSKTCRALFKGQDPVKLLKQIKIITPDRVPTEYDNSGIKKTGKWDPRNPAVTIQTGKAKGIYINPNGSFFEESNQTMYVGRRVSAVYARILTIIHELLHIARTIPDDIFPDDINNKKNQEKSMKNTELVDNNCLKNSVWNTLNTIGQNDISNGGGGGSDNTNYYGRGGYPSWMHSTWEFVDWVNSIKIGIGSEPIITDLPEAE